MQQTTRIPTRKHFSREQDYVEHLLRESRPFVDFLKTKVSFGPMQLTLASKELYQPPRSDTVPTQQRVVLASVSQHKGLSRYFRGGGRLVLGFGWMESGRQGGVLEHTGSKPSSSGSRGTAQICTTF